jgi:predicted Zn-dependent protease
VRSDPRRAREILDELRAEQPDSPAVGIGEALLAVGQGNAEAARAQLAAVLKSDPSLREALRADPDLGPLVAA